MNEGDNSKAASVQVLNDPKTINGWAMFDWANSAYALVITVAIFPAYYSSLSDGPVELMGRSYNLASLFSYAISAAYLLLAAVSPLLSGIADASGRKLAFLRGFTIVGSLACLSMWWFEGLDQLGLGTLLFMVATIGFSGALVFYNAFLPQIASEDRYDAVSARGFSFGYVGSIILLVGCLVMILSPGLIGLYDGTDVDLIAEATRTATRISFVLVGVWWLGFGLFSFTRLPKDDTSKVEKGWLKAGYQEILKTWKEARSQPALIRFLTAFFFYSAGVQTVLFLASTFAESELAFDTTELIKVVLLLQVVAIGGAWLFAKASSKFGNINALLTMLAIWVAVCCLAYFVTEKTAFYAIAALVGLVMGGIQSLSRSTYSKLIPEDTEDNTSYFSFYDLLEKLAIVIGTFSFGMINQITGGMRASMLSLVIFFLIGGILLWTMKGKVKNKRGVIDAIG
ncbi:MAG: MFS transporter [Saprospiraceae bacterium]